MMILNCKHCGSQIPAANINVAKLIAVCPNCSAVYPFEQDVRQGHDRDLPHEKTKRKMVGLPARMRVDESDDKLRLSYRWFTASAFAMLLFTVFWSGISFTVAGAFLFTGAVSDMGFFVFIPLLFVFISFGFIYFTIALFVNTTYIIASHKEIRVYSAPLPTFNNKLIRAEDIGQLYVRQVVSRNDNSTSISYDVRAVMTQGPEQKLVTSLSAPDQAFYIEQRLEHFLEIENQAVIGEFRGYR